MSLNSVHDCRCFTLGSVVTSKKDSVPSLHKKTGLCVSQILVHTFPDSTPFVEKVKDEGNAKLSIFNKKNVYYHIVVAKDKG